MNRTFTPQEQQQLNSTGMCDDSAVLDDGNIKESIANREEQQEIRNKRILIVDDEPDITFTLRIILEENGFKEVDVFNEPLLALQKFKSRVYSLLITDVAMPRTGPKNGPQRGRTKEWTYSDFRNRHLGQKNRLSISSVVRRCFQCSAGKS